MTCEACRAQHAEDARPVPCDTGGLDACPYWRTHGISPGALQPLPLVAVALEVWQRGQALGWEMVDRWLPIALSPQDAETVIEVLYALRCAQADQQAEAVQARQDQVAGPRGRAQHS